MANTLISPTWVLKDVGLGYEENARLVENIKLYDNKYEFGGAKVGDTILYRLPNRFTVKRGQGLQVQALLDQTVPISLTEQLQVSFDYSSAAATTQIEEVRKRYTQPAGASLAATTDAFAFLTIYPEVFNSVGTPGTTPSTTLTYLTAGVKLSDGGAPDSDLLAVLDSMAMATIANTQSTLFHPGGQVSETWRKGQFGSMALGFEKWYRDPNRPLHTTGTFTASTPLVNGASQTGASIITDGWASGASSLKRGDIFTMAAVYSVNPLSYVSTGRLQQFSVTADISDTTGAMTIAITPSIITSGPLQTVSASPANDAAITVWSAVAAGGTLATTVSPVSMILHPESAALVTADLAMPEGGAKGTRFSSKSGNFAFRMVQQYDSLTDQNITRIDSFVGAALLQGRLACRVQG